MGAIEPLRDQRVLVIGLSSLKNNEVVAGLRDLSIDAVGCTEPDTAAERYDARNFGVIAFGRATLGLRADRLKHAFSGQNPGVDFVDAFGPIAVAQVAAALRHRPDIADLVDELTFIPDECGGQVTALVRAACHLRVSLYRQPIPSSVEETCLLDAHVTEGLTVCPLTDLSEAYSLVVIVNGEEFHHLPFL